MHGTMRKPRHKAPSAAQRARSARPRSTARAMIPSTSSHVRRNRRATALKLASLSHSITTRSSSAGSWSVTRRMPTG